MASRWPLIVAAFAAPLLISHPLLAQPGDHGADFSGVWTNLPPEHTRSFQNSALRPDLPPMTPWAHGTLRTVQADFRPPERSGTRDQRSRLRVLQAGDTANLYAPVPDGDHPDTWKSLMLFEYDHAVRQIFTDGRDHRTDLAPMWMGDSTGHWEGETLVVETVNFNDKTWIDRQGYRTARNYASWSESGWTTMGICASILRSRIRWHSPSPGPASGAIRPVDWDIEEFACMDNVNFEAFEDAILNYEPGAEE